ncbi:MAG TPA: galactokinase [Steroidobacteraceae bacterium]|nr:galactokinase [Steroidobacteraceae bacterium]
MSAQTLFAETFGCAPQALASATGRVNLLGEHTDYNDGLVLPTAIDLRTEVAIGRSRDGAFHFVSQNLADAAARVDYEDGSAPPLGYGRYVHGCIEVMRGHGGAVEPCCVAIRSSVPMGAGLSSSAALEVAVLRGLRALYGLEFDDVTIAKLGQRAEIEYAGVHCGILDQMAVSVGEPGKLLFLDTRTLESRLVSFPPGSEIAILDCGVPRTLAASGYNERRRECEQAARALGVESLRDAIDSQAIESLPQPLRRRARHVYTENLRVLEAAAGVDAPHFGKLMTQSHQSLRDDYEVSIDALDALVESLLEQRAVFGCKLTGAGFGGACVALLAAGSGPEVKRGALQAFSTRGFHGSVLL